MNRLEMQRGLANTRWRDWADLWNLSRRHEFNAAELEVAIRSVAEHRAVRVTLLSALAPHYPSSLSHDGPRGGVALTS